MQLEVDASAAGPAAASAQTGRKVLFSAVKDEAPFLLEWIAYHKVIGFDEIVLCSNPSSDGTEELLAALAEAGEIRHLQTLPPPGQRPQTAAAWAFRKQVGYREGDWYLWLDADEFLNVHAGDHTVDALIAGLDGKECALINWRVFGAGGNTRFPGRFIAPEFSGASAPKFRSNLEQKAIFRASKAVVGFAHKGFHRPLVARPAIWTHADVLVGSGASLSEDTIVNRRWLEGANNGRTSKVDPSEFGWSLGQINHYMVRTAEFFALKRLRGRGAYPNPPGGSNRRHTPAFFAENDRNEVEDRTILRWQDRVTTEIDRLLQLQGVADAKAASNRLVAAILAARTLPVGDAPPPPPSPPAPIPATAPSGLTLSAAAVAAPPRKVLFSAMKNEAPFLLEWIAYHKAIGFDDVVICSNPSNDGTEAVLEALAQAGEIIHLKAEPTADLSAQTLGAMRFSEQVGFRDGNWYLWLDADEFLNIHVGDRSLDALIDHLQGRHCALINWRIFGSSGNRAFGGRFISPAFSRASGRGYGANVEVKSLFRFSPAFRGFAKLGVNRPLVAPGGTLGLQDVLTGNGGTLSKGFRPHGVWLKGVDSSATLRVPPAEFGWALAQINHYIVRTPEFFALKKARGRGWKANSEGEANLRHTAEFFEKHDRNEDEDRSILAWEDRVTAGLDRLLGQPGVAAAKAASDRLVADILSAQSRHPPVALAATPAAPPAALPAALAATPLAAANPPTSQRATPPGRPRHVLFSAMKNEAPFLLEWLAYHKSIGFDEIVICSNPSNDGTEDILAALALAGEITHLRAEPQPGDSPQAAAARLFAGSQGYRDGTWYLWLDADEFLNVHVGNRTVADLVAAVGPHDCLFVNWRIFGSSGNARFPGRVIDPAFQGAASQGFEANAGLKSFFRMSGKFQGFATVGIHRPLVSKDGGLTGKDVITGNGRHLSVDYQRHRNWLSGDSFGPNWTVDAPEVGWALAQINHYMVRTPEFFALKKARGRGWKADSEGDANLRHTGEFFQKHDRNDEEDRSILVWQDQVTAEIARLNADPGVAAAVATSASLVTGLLTGMDPAPAPQAPAPDLAAVPSFKLTFPPAETGHVKEAYARARVILEYGSGGSTMLAAELGKTVFSVESDRAWAGRMDAALAGHAATARVLHIDIGPTKSWGRPVDRKASANFHLYALSVWDQLGPLQPDLVLIDGRFRAACLAAVRLRAQAPTTVLFDDYADRPYYHRVEALARKEAMIGRMARFTVTPGPIPPDMLSTVVGWFSDPR